MLGYETLESLIESVVPKSILETDPLNVGDGMTELEALKELDKIAKENSVFEKIFLLGKKVTCVPVFFVFSPFFKGASGTPME